MERKNKIILFTLLLISCTLLIYFFGKNKFERYISNFIPRLAKKYGVELSFLDVRFKYLDQSITLTGVKFSGQIGNREFSSIVGECTLKFKRVISNWKNPFRALEFKNGWVKVKIKKEEKHNQKLPWFLYTVPVKMEHIRLELETPNGLYKVEVKEGIHSPTRNKWSEEWALNFIKLQYGNLILHNLSLNTYFSTTSLRSGKGMVQGSTPYGEIKKMNFEWVKGEGFTVEGEFGNISCPSGLINLCSGFKKSKHLALAGVLNLKNKDFSGRFSFSNLEWKNLEIDSGKGEIRADIIKHSFNLKNTELKYKGSLIYLNGIVKDNRLSASLRFSNLPFEKLLFSLGVRSRVFSLYSGNIEVNGSLRPLHFKGKGNLTVKDFAVCESIYPSDCGKKILHNNKATLKTNFTITDEKTVFEDVKICLTRGCFTAKGELSYSKYLDLYVKLDHLNVAGISPIGGVPMKGYLNGDVYIRGPFKDIVIYYKGTVNSYGIFTVSPGDGNVSIYYRDKKLYYNFSRNTVAGSGLLEFSRKVKISHFSAFENMSAGELSSILSLPPSVTGEINKIHGKWRGTLFISSTENGGVIFSATLESENTAEYLGEKIDKFYAEGRYFKGTMEYRIIGEKGKEFVGEGGYKNGKVYFYASGSKIRTDRFQRFAHHLSVDVLWRGSLHNMSLTYYAKEEKGIKSVEGVLDKNYHLIKIIPSRGVIFWERMANLNYLIGCVQRFNIIDFLPETKDFSSNLNVCGSINIPSKTSPEFLVYPSWIKAKNLIMSGGSPDGSRTSFIYGDTWINIKSEPQRIVLKFNLPSDLFSGYLNTSFSTGRFKGKISIPLVKGLTAENIHGEVFLHEITARLPFIYLENVSGKLNLKNGQLTFYLKQKVPLINLEGLYDFKSQSTNGYLNVERGEIKMGASRGRGGLSLRWVGTRDRVTLEGNVKITEGFIPFRLLREGRQKIGTVSGIFLNNLNVSVENLEIKGSGLELSLGGDISLSGEINSPDVRGEMSVRGKLKYMGKNFEVKKGKVMWYSGGETPFIELLAETEVEKKVLRIGETALRYKIYLDVKGSPPDLEVELYSSPPLTRENILTLMFTGKTMEDIFATEIKGKGASAQLSDIGIEMILGEEFRSIGKVSGLDVFSISPRYSENLNRTTTYIRVGKSIGKELWMEYSRDLNFDEQEFLLIWRPTKHIMIRGGWDNTFTRYQISSPEFGNLSVDFIFANEF